MAAERNNQIVLFLLCALWLLVAFGKEKNDTEINDYLLLRILKTDQRLNEMGQKIEQIGGQEISELMTEANEQAVRLVHGFGSEKKFLRDQTKYLVEVVNDNEVQMEEVLNRMENFEAILSKIQEEIRRDRELNNHSTHNLELKTNKLSSEISEKMTDHERVLEGLLHRFKRELASREEMVQKINLISENLSSLKADQKKTRAIVNHFQSSFTCPEGWERQLFSCILYVHDRKRTWSRASRNCKNKGSILAEPYTAVAFNLLRKNAPIKPRSWYLGARRDGDGFLWEQGNSKMDLSSWSPGEPSNDFGKGNCLEIWNYYDLLNDVPCDTERYSICEIKQYLYKTPAIRVHL